jgi:hypothetical protein
MRLYLCLLTPEQNNHAPKTEEKKEKTMFKFRVARPTDNLPEIVRFYRDGLGLEPGGFHHQPRHHLYQE